MVEQMEEDYEKLLKNHPTGQKGKNSSKLRLNVQYFLLDDQKASLKLGT